VDSTSAAVATTPGTARAVTHAAPATSRATRGATTAQWTGRTTRPTNQGTRTSTATGALNHGHDIRRRWAGRRTRHQRCGQPVYASASDVDPAGDRTTDLSSATWRRASKSVPQVGVELELALAGAQPADPSHDQPGGDRVRAAGEGGVADLGDIRVGLHDLTGVGRTSTGSRSTPCP